MIIVSLHQNFTKLTIKILNPISVATSSFQTAIPIIKTNIKVGIY